MKVFLLYDLSNLTAHELIRAFATEEAAVAAMAEEDKSCEDAEWFINEVEVEN